PDWADPVDAAGIPIRGPSFRPHGAEQDAGMGDGGLWMVGDPHFAPMGRNKLAQGIALGISGGSGGSAWACGCDRGTARGSRPGAGSAGWPSRGEERGKTMRLVTP